MQELTGIEDHDKCVEILSLHQWSLEASIQDTLNEKEGMNPIFTPPPNAPTQPQDLRRRIQVPITRYARVQQTPRGAVARQYSWWDWLVNIALFPIRFTVTTASDLFQFVSELCVQFLIRILFTITITPSTWLWTHYWWHCFSCSCIAFTLCVRKCCYLWSFFHSEFSVWISRGPSSRSCRWCPTVCVRVWEGLWYPSSSLPHLWLWWGTHCFML